MADDDARKALSDRAASDLAELWDIIAMLEADPEIGPLLSSPELSAPGGFIDPDNLEQSELHQRARSGLLCFRQALITARRGLEVGFPDRIARELRTARKLFDDGRLLWQQYKLGQPRRAGGQKRGQQAAQTAAERQAPFRAVYERRRKDGATHERAARAVDKELQRRGVAISSTTRARWLKSFREGFWSQAS